VGEIIEASAVLGSQDAVTAAAISAAESAAACQVIYDNIDLSNYVTKLNPTMSGTLTHSGNLTFTGTGNRITGDFSNTTVANRVMFQTSTVNGVTEVDAIPNGVGAQSSIRAYNNSDPVNAANLAIVALPAEVSLRSAITGSGTYLPMTFYTGGAERMRINNTGELGIGGSNSAVNAKLQVQQASNSYGIEVMAATGGTNVGVSSFRLLDAANTVERLLLRGDSNTLSTISTSANLAVMTAGVERMRIDASGNVLVTAPAGLGYGTGAGGTVTQATNKSTAVTLNKPAGKVTTAADALGAGITAAFNMNNTLIGANDCVILTKQSGLSDAAYNIWPIVAAGVCVIYIKNISGGSLSEAIPINFVIIKGSVS
jgi:hypothetical protein